jgi:hypothetical protein
VKAAGAIVGGHKLVDDQRDTLGKPGIRKNRKINKINAV